MKLTKNQKRGLVCLESLLRSLADNGVIEIKNPDYLQRELGHLHMDELGDAADMILPLFHFIREFVKRSSS